MAIWVEVSFDRLTEQESTTWKKYVLDDGTFRFRKSASRTYSRMNVARLARVVKTQGGADQSARKRAYSTLSTRREHALCFRCY